MEIVYKKLRVRELVKEDLGNIHKWLTDQRVLKYYGGRDKQYTLDNLQKKYFSDNSNKILRVIIEYDDVAIGYGQIYMLEDELYNEYEYFKTDKKVYAMDQYIGEVEYWNKGIGTEYIKLMLSFLRQEKGADAVLLDPHTTNLRAIQCYIKAGFKIIKELPNHELFEGKKEDCYLMEYKYETVE